MIERRTSTRASLAVKRRTKISCVLITLTLFALSLSGGHAWAASGGLPGPGDSNFNPASDTDDNQCVTPDGADVNAVLGVSEQVVVAGACDVVNAGEFYVPVVFWYTNTFFGGVPEGYTPAGPTPMDDFLAKVTSVRYTIDAGTAQERTFRYRAQDVLKLRTLDEFFTGPPLPIAISVATLPPLPPGGHRFDAFFEMSAPHCDGLGITPANCLLAGENPANGSCPFTVVRRASQAG